MTGDCTKSAGTSEPAHGAEAYSRWLERLRRDWLAPLDDLVQASLTALEAAKDLPVPVLLDLHKLVEASRGLGAFARQLAQEAPADLPGAEAEKELRRNRHQLGNYLNRVSG